MPEENVWQTLMINSFPTDRPDDGELAYVVLAAQAPPHGDLHAMPAVSAAHFCGPLDDRVRELCARVVTAAEEELHPAIAELRSVLREHNRRLRALAAEKLANSRPGRWRHLLRTEAVTGSAEGRRRSLL
jgi:hypothetical protein